MRVRKAFLGSLLAAFVLALMPAGDDALWGQNRSRSRASSRGSSAGASSGGRVSNSVPSRSRTSSGGGGTYSSSSSYGRSRGFGGYSDPYYRRGFPAQPYSFSGRVALPGGGAPGEPAIIQSVCGGRVSPLAYCDRNGRFGFQLGHTPWALDPLLSIVARDPRNGSLFYRQNLSSCQLRAFFPGYGSTMFSLTGRGAFDSPRIGTFELSRTGDINGTSVSITSLAAPKKAKKHYRKALKHMRNSNLEKAAKQLEQAVTEHPDYAAAWALLGEVRQALQYESGVREAFERALEADWQYLRPYAPLIRLAVEDGDWEEAAELAEKAVRLNPMQTEVRYHLALAQYKLGRHDQALKTVRAALAADDVGEIPRGHALAGTILAKQGKREQAAAEYRKYLASRPETAVAAAIQQDLVRWQTQGRIEDEPALPLQ